MEDSALRLFGDAGLVTEIRLDTNLNAVVRMVITQSVSKAVQSSGYQTSAEK